MPGPLLRRQNRDAGPEMGTPVAAPSIGTRAAPVARCIREIPQAMSSDQRVSAAAIHRSACCSRGGAAMHASPRRTVIIAAAVLPLGCHSGPARNRRSRMAWWLGAGSAGLRDRIRCALLRRLLWRPVLRLRATVFCAAVGRSIAAVIATCGGLASATRGPFCNFWAGLPHGEPALLSLPASRDR
jgi:hypothetical protein